MKSLSGIKIVEQSAVFALFLVLHTSANFFAAPLSQGERECDQNTLSTTFVINFKRKRKPKVSLVHSLVHYYLECYSYCYQQQFLDCSILIVGILYSLRCMKRDHSELTIFRVPDSTETIQNSNLREKTRCGTKNEIKYFLAVVLEKHY